ncbi:MAG: hypothetical protein M1150_01360 [Patescibacteria group bacterium]|nr:hypothetical protein [Patescibacteria group bacterium]
MEDAGKATDGESDYQTSDPLPKDRILSPEEAAAWLARLLGKTSETTGNFSPCLTRTYAVYGS